MTILSIPAASLLAARLVREAGGELSEALLLDRLADAGVHDPLRREAAVRHAVHAGRLAEFEAYPDGGAEGADPILAIATSIPEAA